MTGSPACAGDDSLSQNTRTIMPRTKPPFRADHVGSLLRPAVLKQARAKRERGEITAEELETIEDREIEAVIRKQEDGASFRDRRRVSPRLLELRFPRPARRRRSLSRRAQDQVPGPATQAHDAARDRQARRLSRPSDDRAFQIRRRACQSDNEQG